jgi:uncharacterized protein (UPF0335 family)
MKKLTAYNNLFQEIIETINSSRYKAYKSLNRFHIGQNFEIGRIIVKSQQKNEWGESIVDTLSKDINKQIDGVKGAGIDSKVIENIFKKYKKLIPEWSKFIEDSFLSDSMKEEYKSLLKHKATQIEL